MSSPELLTVAEVATFLRTSTNAIYLMISRGQLPGVVHVGRRVFVRRADLHKSVGVVTAPPPSRSAS